MAIVTALNAPVDMGALRSYAGTVTTSTVSGGTLQTIKLNAADFVEFTLANVGGQQVVTSMIQARFLPGVDGLADNLVTEPVFILESLSANPSLVTSLAGGANTTQTIAALLQGPDQINGSSFGDRLLGYNGNDLITGAGGNDTIDGGDGINVAAYAGVRAEYTISLQPNGSYLVIDNVAGRDGTDTVSNVVQLQFIDDVFDLASFDPAAAFVSLVNANASQAKAISAAYQILLGGVPAQAGYNFLITSNLTSNFGAGPGPVFNDENIYINVANSLVQGNATAAAKFNALATGTTLQDKIGALYGKLIPLGQQTAEGRAFFTRPEGIKFYQDVAKERGIVADNGAAVVAFAAILKVAVDAKIGIGNPVTDLLSSISLQSSGLPATSTTLLPIETVDGTQFDADDARDAPSVTPPPVALIGLDAVDPAFG